MNPNREEALFQLAQRKPAGTRASWLDAECDGDEALRRRVEALVSAHESTDEAVGQTLGHDKLREKLGEGGSGTVYVAGQTEPVRRWVALKVIRLGMDTREVMARFEGERQALAMMDHPTIAKVLDAGTTEPGRPPRPPRRPPRLVAEVARAPAGRHPRRGGTRPSKDQAALNP